MICGWQTECIKMNMPTTNKTDNLVVFENDFSKLKSGKAESINIDNEIFTAWFKTDDGKRIGNTYGIWKSKGDSLCVNYPYLR